MPERDEALLPAVMEVALDAAALVVGGGQDPRARGAQLGQRVLDLCGQPAVVVPDEARRLPTASTNGRWSPSAASWITAATGPPSSEITVA